MKEKHLTPEELAARWNIEQTTLSQWRWNGRGPAFTKEAHRIQYHLQDIEHFEKQQLRQATSSAHGEGSIQDISEDSLEKKEESEVIEK
ncbi:MAG: DNA-binding protein [Alphaproteobacteria bacterium]|nr:DNA-binding protein [Alphaproteobacteria bacterium]